MAAYALILVFTLRIPTLQNVGIMLLLILVSLISRFQESQLKHKEFAHHRVNVQKLEYIQNTRLLPMHFSVMIALISYKFSDDEGRNLTLLLLFIIPKMLTDLILEISWYRRTRKFAREDMADSHYLRGAN
jgi:hypothetical protein